jgi:hypothetical protein
MDTMEYTEVATSPFAGPALSAGESSPPALERFDSHYLPAASPFAEGLTAADERQAVESQWLALVDELTDESFDEALDGLVDEAAGRYLRARSRAPHDSDGAQARQDVEAWLAGQAEMADRALANLEREYADHLAPLGEQESSVVEGLSGANGPGAPMDQLFGGLVGKAFKAAGAVASGLAKVLPVGRIFGLLRPLVQPLLKRVLDKALGKLPAPLQGPARTLAGKLGLGEDETTDSLRVG